METIESRDIKNFLPFFLKYKRVWADYDEIADILYMHFKKPNHADNSEMTDVAELLLYSASRNQLCRQKIHPALDNQTIVICDRFYDSTTAYQGYARGIDLDFINKLNMIATDNLIPDLTFLLDISMETRSDRLDANNLDRLEQEHLDFHRRVRSGFLKMAAKNPNRFVIIDGTKPITEISNLIWNRFLEKITLEN